MWRTAGLGASHLRRTHAANEVPAESAVFGNAVELTIATIVAQEVAMRSAAGSSRPPEAVPGNA